ncbi:MAG: hypothetical protein JO001_19580 [Alphaproteobacteria bacterium]|nr:hypothetical protein [Alphaproteobacteria bacterium]
MSENEAAAAIAIAISALGMLVVVSLLRTYMIDNFRNQLFALRDEMFLYAWDEGLLDSRAYLNLRVLMNGMIRYAHRTSISRLMILDAARRLFKIPLKMPDAFAQWVTAISNLPSDQAQKFQEYHNNALRIAMRHMVNRSPILWIGIVVLGIHFGIWRSAITAIDRAANVLRNKMLPSDLFESEAYKAAR